MEAEHFGTVGVDQEVSGSPHPRALTVSITYLFTDFFVLVPMLLPLGFISVDLHLIHVRHCDDLLVVS